MNRAMCVDIEVRIERFAQELAGKNDEEQCVFFDSFFRSLYECCGNDRYKTQLQLLSIVSGQDHRLNENSIECIESLCYFCKENLKEEKK